MLPRRIVSNFYEGSKEVIDVVKDHAVDIYDSVAEYSMDYSGLFFQPIQHLHITYILETAPFHRRE